MKLEISEATAVKESDSYILRKKPITTTRKAPDERQVRDTFQTPNYAIDLLIPFIPKGISHVWECAAGGGKISGKLRSAGYTVFETDIQSDREGVEKYNFITGEIRTDIEPGKFSIITNPPFSIKDLFVEKCFEYSIPFALLINADYSGQTIEWIRRGCEKIVPTSRIAYITPNILSRIHAGEIWKLEAGSSMYESLDNLRDADIELYEHFYQEKYKDYHNYSTIEEVPMELLYKYSNAQFHSMWLTYGFGLGKTETFVDLTAEQRRSNI